MVLVASEILYSQGTSAAVKAREFHFLNCAGIPVAQNITKLT